MIAHPLEAAGNPEALHACLHAVLLIGSEVALGIAEVIHRIEQIGFATAVCTRNTGNGGAEFEGTRRIIPELD